jgi:lysophospholipase L1-like esterase
VSSILIILACTIFVVLIVLIIQGYSVNKNAIRLPEAIGERSCINNNKISLLHIGESTVAGVGVKTMDEGLTAHIIQYLSDNKFPDIDWQILGGNGAKIANSLAMKSVLDNPDILIITFGVNDTKGFTSHSQWVKNITQCVKKFSGPHTNIYFTSVPPMHKFPLLPVPLRFLLGIKTKLLDNSLKSLCMSKNWHHIRFTSTMDSFPMAEDGFHPSGSGYKEWGKTIAENILKEHGYTK